MTRKTKKNSAPSHLKDVTINMPLDEFLNDLIKIFKHNKELAKALNNEKGKIEDINDIIKLDQANELMNLIMTNIFEEDVIEETVEEKFNK